MRQVLTPGLGIWLLPLLSFQQQFLPPHKSLQVPSCTISTRRDLLQLSNLQVFSAAPSIILFHPLCCSCFHRPCPQTVTRPRKARSRSQTSRWTSTMRHDKLRPFSIHIQAQHHTKCPAWMMSGGNSWTGKCQYRSRSRRRLISFLRTHLICTRRPSMSLACSRRKMCSLY